MKGVLIFTTNLMKSSGFYTDALGMKCQHLTSNFAEFQDEYGNYILLRHTDSIAYTSAGFNPILIFEKKNFDESFENCKKYGALPDGEPVTTQLGKIVYLKSPDGYSFAIKEYQAPTVPKSDSQQPDPLAEELQKLFQKLKI